MKNITLPAILKPITRRTDKSVKLSFETRELSPQEVVEIMFLEGTEGWLQLSPNNIFEEAPKENAQVNEKSRTQRLRATLFVFAKQQIAKGKHVGLPETYVEELLEKLITKYQEQLDN